MSKGDREPSQLDHIQIAQPGRSADLHSVEIGSMSATEILGSGADAAPQVVQLLEELGLIS